MRCSCFASIERYPPAKERGRILGFLANFFVFHPLGITEGYLLTFVIPSEVEESLIPSLESVLGKLVTLLLTHFCSNHHTRWDGVRWDP
jgi:hypothetical protein